MQNCNYLGPGLSTCSCNTGYDINSDNKGCNVTNDRVLLLNSNSSAIAIGSSVAGCCILALIIIFMIYRRKDSNNVGEKKPFDVEGSMAQTSSLFEQKYAFIPIETELNPNDIGILHELNRGRFGKLHLAQLVRADETTEVVVKKLPGVNQNAQEELRLIAEIKVMLDIGQHRNIVNFIGQVTNLRPIMLVLEYCSHGNLYNYIKKVNFGAAYS